MAKKRVLKMFLILIVLSLLVSATYASNPCGCTCICNNTCPADQYGQLPHRMISTGEAYVYHCDTDTHWFF